MCQIVLCAQHGLSHLSILTFPTREILSDLLYNEETEVQRNKGTGIQLQVTLGFELTTSRIVLLEI